MNTVRDVIMTVIILVGSIGAIIALPFVAAILVIGIAAFLIYAVLHDRRIAEDEED